MSNAVKDEGLRERKRAATQATIEAAAIDLALKHGYDITTVDMICDASMVSQRTFFNYFGSKESVILGARALPTEAAVDAFVAGRGRNALSDLVDMIATALATRELDPELFSKRRQVIQRTPELSNAEMARMIEAQDELTRIVLARFRAQGRKTTPGIQDEAGMVVALAIGVVHFAMKKWRASNFRSNPHELLQKSIELVERITTPQ